MTMERAAMANGDASLVRGDTKRKRWRGSIRAFGGAMRCGG